MYASRESREEAFMNKITTVKELPDSEKAYDRITAEGTLKLILSLGFKITK